MTTQTEALKLAQKALSNRNAPAKMIYEALHAIKEALAQPKPVAMKFKIYKPTVPDPLRQDINNALLPWVYDQDRSSGFDATMWVTPVATLPPKRTWVGLTLTQVKLLWEGVQEEAVKSGDSLNWVFYTHINEALKEKNT